jgi:hypothetical protein
MLIGQCLCSESWQISVGIVGTSNESKGMMTSMMIPYPIIPKFLTMLPRERYGITESCKIDKGYDKAGTLARWRPFQLAFLISQIEGITNPSSADRDTVDLIWFPTGGGKTEAYLGLQCVFYFFTGV